MSTTHPHFDDRGNLSWHTRWSDALAQARKEQKPIFIEMGRQACGQCRTLVQRTLPREDVAPLVRDGFVALAADCDDLEPEVEELAMQLEGASMLPFLLFTDSEGSFVEGMSGVVSADQLKAALARVSG